MKNYNFSYDIKMIRTCLGLSQIDFAEEVSLSRSNIARYEAGIIQPRYDALEKIYNYAFTHKFDINQAKTMLHEDNRKNNLLLFHGAKDEIIGDVDTRHSKEINDFGDGFYLGQTLSQANIWAATNKKSSTYCFYFNRVNDLKGIEFDVGYRWMYAILYYRGELGGYHLTKEIKDIINQIEKCDYIIAPIADNQMYDNLEAFRNNLITDEACLHALNANNLGKQYVMKSQKACNHLTPIDRLYLCKEEREHYLNMKRKQLDDGKSKVELALVNYRRKGKYFDELFKKEG